ncbi:hypothetical protein BV25DRAFT_1816483 [Artomyces pyxidatus]|uniref:Uncharacterized protein n=1 Tax=Artomyces pyxidatus TaxID=48021 RepID=A0ACB8SEZ7_9AGAM|nr:hypothetical protein BV25DRAFT_1816483 [Artomyces pyxidatus]
MTVPVDIDSDKWPPWLTEAVTHFQSLKLGVGWDACIAAFVQIERCAGFQVCSLTLLLGAKERPAIVGEWIKNARPWTGEFWRAPNVNAHTFAEQWWAWWGTLQPEDRPQDSNGKFLRTEEELDWSGITVGGKNGMISVMASLVLWADACARSETRDMSQWMTAVDDVVRVMQEADRCEEEAEPETVDVGTKRPAKYVFSSLACKPC